MSIPPLSSSFLPPTRWQAGLLVNPGRFFSQKKTPGRTGGTGAVGCLAPCLKAAASCPKSSRLDHVFQKAKSPRRKATGSSTNPHRPLAHLYSGASNLDKSPLCQ